MRRTSISRQQSSRKQEARLRGFAALNRVRQGKSKTLSHAARVEGTTLKFIRQVFPAALIQKRPSTRIRVKASDAYSARVEIMTGTGPLIVTARGSRQRELAGRHRATVERVRRGKVTTSVLKQFRDKRVGGHELISDFDQLYVLAQAGVLDQLDTLYVSPDTSA